MEHKVKILMTEFVTHDVKRFIVEKPKNYKFIPGQATLISIDEISLKKEKRPVTITSLNDDLVLEFMIKKYPEHKGITEKLHKLKAGDRVIIEEPFGSISYKGEGVFLAAGTGITPFVAIFRQLKKENKFKKNELIFSNKTSKDVILEKELKELFRKDLILTLTREKKDGYENKRIDWKFLKQKIKNLNQYFYICGPEKFVEDIRKILKEIGIKDELVVTES